MTARFAGSSCRPRLIALCSIAAVCCSLVLPSDNRVKYLGLAEASETLKRFADSGIAGTNIADPDEWDRWIRDQDSQVRGRIDRGVEDSISNLILYGTSYTSLPRFESPESALTVDGNVSEDARARLNALHQALGSPDANERISFIRNYLWRKRITSAQTQQFLTANLQRFAREQQVYQEKLEKAQNSGDVNQMLLTRGTLYENRGLSADTSLMTNYALEETLRSLMTKGILFKGRIERIAVIGPGLDFTNKHNGYDFYPLQTIQPFAVLETALRLQLAEPNKVEVFTLDLNPAVNEHVAKLAQNARAGLAYRLQLPRDPTADWPPGAASYWKRFGEVIGAEVEAPPVPQAAGAVTLRAVAIAPRFASHISALDVNIVTQRMHVEQGHGFDLVVATNILVYYDLFQQALAMANIAHMLNRGGVFLSNDTLSSHHVSSLAFEDRHTVSFSTHGPYGDNVLTYRKK